MSLCNCSNSFALSIAYKCEPVDRIILIEHSQFCLILNFFCDIWHICSAFPMNVLLHKNVLLIRELNSHCDCLLIRYSQSPSSTFIIPNTNTVPNKRHDRIVGYTILAYIFSYTGTCTLQYDFCTCEYVTPYNVGGRLVNFRIRKY